MRTIFKREHTCKECEKYPDYIRERHRRTFPLTVGYFEDVLQNFGRILLQDFGAIEFVSDEEAEDGHQTPWTKEDE